MMISYNHGYDGDMAVRTASAPGHHHHSTGVYSSSLEKVHKSPRIFFKMPRVVPNQKERFETEDIFKKNTKDQEVRKGQVFFRFFYSVYWSVRLW